MPRDLHAALLTVVAIAHEKPAAAQPVPAARGVGTGADGAGASAALAGEQHWRLDGRAGVDGGVDAGRGGGAERRVDAEVHGGGGRVAVGAAVEAQPRQLAVGDLHGVLVDRAGQPVRVLEAGLGPRQQVRYGLRERLVGGLGRRRRGERLLLDLRRPAQAGGEGGEDGRRDAAAVELLVCGLHRWEEGLCLEHRWLCRPGEAGCVFER